MENLSDGELVMSRQNDENNLIVKLPVYMRRETREILEELKFDIEQISGFSVSLSQLMRDAIIHFMKKHRTDAIQRYGISTMDDDCDSL